MKYLTFEDISDKEAFKHKKTKTFKVINHYGDSLGFILWSGHWRQYVLEHFGISIHWSSGCLKQVTEFINELMRNKKRELGDEN